MAISEIIAQFSKMFDKTNKKVCSNCPQAKPNSTVADCRDNSAYIAKEAGCCSKCYSVPGYFYDTDDFAGKCGDETLKLRDDTIAKFKQNYGYDEKYGFFDNGMKRCRIPREYRSVACLGFMCDSIPNYYRKRRLAKKLVKELLAIRDYAFWDDFIKEVK